MAKKKYEPNLFDNNYFGGFDVEGENNSFEIDKKKDNAHPIISPHEQVVSKNKIDSIEAFSIRTQPLLEKAIKFISIKDDDENTNARALGKELTDLKKEIEDEKKKRNKPLKEEMDSNTEKAKKLIEPIEKQVDRLKSLITTYELEKERKRKEELERIEKEKKEKEEKERKEAERVSKIRNEISRLRDLSHKSISDANTEEALNKIELNLKNWQPKKEYFMEFYDEVNINLKKEIQSLIDGRRPIVKELDEARKKAEELQAKNKEAAEKERKLLEEKLADERKKKEQEAAMKKAQEDAEELSARNELTVLIASLGVKDFEGYLKKIVSKYSTCRQAVLKRDEIIKSYQDEQDKLRQIQLLEQQKIKNQRIDFVFTIDDETKVPIQYLSVDEKKIKKAIQENREALEKDINSFKIDGVTITSKVQTVLKKG